MTTILITGGAGFIGSHVARKALEMGINVKLFDNFLENNTEPVKDLEGKVELIKGNIMDYELLRDSCNGVDYISHQAALRSVPVSLKEPAKFNEVNINGTLNVLEAAKHCGVKRVVFASSSSVYGETESFPEKETDAARPISPYAITKLAGELYMKSYYKLYGLETVSLRYFNVYGPLQDPDSIYAAVIPLFIKGLYNGQAPTMFGDGTQSRDFTYVKNVAEANLLACTAQGAAGEVFNIGSGRNTDLNTVFKKIAENLGKDVEPAYIENRKGDVKHSLADISKAKRILGYEPRYNFDEGLKETIEWFKANKT